MRLIVGQYAPPDKGKDIRRKVGEMRPLLHYLFDSNGGGKPESKVNDLYRDLIEEAVKLGLIRFRGGLVKLTQRGIRRVMVDTWGLEGYHGKQKWIGKGSERLND